MGIGGLPNVDRSTLFNNTKKLNKGVESIPFCTINPNDARAAVPGDPFGWLCTN